MLSITPQASEAIRGLIDSDSIPDGAMLRIAPQPSDGAQPGAGLAVAVVDQVPDSDQIVEGDEVEVAVEPSTAELLADKELDADVTGEQVAFSIGEQT
jgi:Fe-S cluster assembly iron-binding protein IscA